MDPFVLIVQVQHLVGDLYNGGVLQGVEEGRQDPELEGERHQTISLKLSLAEVFPRMTDISIIFTFYGYNLDVSIH